MSRLRETQRSGLAALEAASTLLRRIRTAHPTKGLYSPAELQWWWTLPRSTDEIGQLFWFDDDERPVAAALLVDFTNRSSAVYEAVTLCPFHLPDAAPDLVTTVVERTLDHARELGIGSIELEVDRTDTVMHDVLGHHGFTIKEREAMTEAWLDADARPEISPLTEGYRLVSRAEIGQRPHHAGVQNPSFSVARLDDAPLYHPDLDLVVLDPDDEYAGYALFWYDSELAIGAVEPVRTHGSHQRRGLSRHLLTTGIDMLARAGAERISICWEPDNPASGPLYRSLGFEAVKQIDLYAGQLS